MNAAAANILLKTLEEPPQATTLLLLTCRPYALLPTIRSRVLHFRFPGMASAVRVEGWEAWLSDYREWLGRLGKGVAAGRERGRRDLRALRPHRQVRLHARQGIGRRRSARRKEALPEALEDEELAAIETEMRSGLRLRMFAGIEEATSAHALELLKGGDAGARRLLHRLGRQPRALGGASAGQPERLGGARGLPARFASDLDEALSIAAPKTPALSPSSGLRNSVRSSG